MRINAVSPVNALVVADTGGGWLFSPRRRATMILVCSRAFELGFIALSLHMETVLERSRSVVGRKCKSYFDTRG